ncbi:conserved hypothetical protein [Pseudomonas sp. OF001]|nr:conserved hypothetical protein [Pseudomonas sp. OF001]
MAGGYCHRPFSVMGGLARPAARDVITTPQGGRKPRVCTIFRLLPSERPNKQVTKLGNADGLLIH